MRPRDADRGRRRRARPSTSPTASSSTSTPPPSCRHVPQLPPFEVDAEEGTVTGAARRRPGARRGGRGARRARSAAAASRSRSSRRTDAELPLGIAARVGEPIVLTLGEQQFTLPVIDALTRAAPQVAHAAALSVPSRSSPRRRHEDEERTGSELGRAGRRCRRAAARRWRRRAWLLLGGDDGYSVKARFQAATNVVKGNLVQVGGRKVGIVEDIELADDGEAELELKIDDERITPLRTGTQATLRIASLSGSANRYVDLRIPPAGGQPLEEGARHRRRRTRRRRSRSTSSSTLFDPETRKGLRGLHPRPGQPVARRRRAGQRRLGVRQPVARRRRAACSRELNYDSTVLEEFVVNSSRLVTDVADRRDDVAALVDQLADSSPARSPARRTTCATRDRRSCRRSCAARTRRSSTCARRSTTSTRVVEASKPVTPKLRARARASCGRSPARPSRPSATSSRSCARRGEDNDLIELAKSVPPLRDIAIAPGQAQRQGAPGLVRDRRPSRSRARRRTSRSSAPTSSTSPAGSTTSATRASTTPTARPAASRPRSTRSPRSAASSSSCPQELRDELGNARRRARGQNNRCPGASERPAADGSNPWKPTPDFNCDPTQIPPGK